MATKTYKQVPVEAARQLAEHFEKACVVIVSFDAQHDKTHFTTYGVTPEQKLLAASLGEAIATAVMTPDALESIRSYEDFRDVDQAKRAVQVEQLTRACRAAEHAINSLLAVRDGMTDESLANVRDALTAALATETPSAP